MAGPIPVRTPPGMVLPVEIGHDGDETILTHPARQARFAYRAMCECGQHSGKFLDHQDHCRAPAWAIAADWIIENPRKYSGPPE